MPVWPCRQLFIRITAGKFSFPPFFRSYTHLPQVKPESAQTRPCCSVFPLGQVVKFFVYPESHFVQSDESVSVHFPVLLSEYPVAHFVQVVGEEHVLQFAGQVTVHLPLLRVYPESHAVQVTPEEELVHVAQFATAFEHVGHMPSS